MSLIFGDDRPRFEAFMQAGGAGHCSKAKAVREAVQSSRTLLPSILRYANSFLHQTARTAVSNGRNKVKERLARWLLLASDRLDNGDLPLAPEFLATMLAVR